MDLKEEQKIEALSKTRTSYAPQTFFKVLSVLNVFTVEQPELSLHQISQRTAIATSSLYRYLRAMEDDGYVARDPESGKYTVGLRLVELGGIALSNLEFRHYGQLALDKLSAKLTMNANIGLLYEGDLMHIVFSVHEDAGLHHSVIGRRSPAHCTAMGKVLLASLGREKAHAILSAYGWRPITSRSISNFKRLDDELDAICSRGYAEDYREANENSGCIAFPIQTRGNKVVAAMSVSTTAARLEKCKQNVIDELGKSAEQLSYGLGFIGPYPMIRMQGYYEKD
jgi:DNA-binding IclR family transcriptional regulator